VPSVPDPDVVDRPRDEVDSRPGEHLPGPGRRVEE
jgi:hypothetical protein